MVCCAARSVYSVLPPSVFTHHDSQFRVATFPCPRGTLAKSERTKLNDSNTLLVFFLNPQLGKGFGDLGKILLGPLDFLIPE